METPLQTKSVNALFAFLKTTLFKVEQMTTGFFTSETATRLSLIPIKEGNLNQLNSAKRPLNSYISIALLLLSLIFVETSAAQGTLGRWEMCGLSGSTGSVTATGVDANTTFSTLTRGPGLSSSSVSNGYRSSGFSTSNLNTSNNDYYEFTITPDAGYKISLSNLKIRDQRSTNTSSFDAYLRFSDDGYASNVVASWLPTTTLTNRTLDLSGVSALQDRTTAITFRIYGSDSNNTSDTYGFFCEGTNSGDYRGIDVDGTAVALPVSIGRWQMCGLSGSTSSVNPTGVNTNLTFSTLTRGPGLSSSSVSNGYRSSSFSTGNNLSTSNNDYYEFTITPDAGYKISLSNLKIRDQRSTNNDSFDAYLRFSDDGYTSDLVASWLPTTTLTNRILDLSGVSALQDRTTAITFRIYGSDANNSSDTYGFFCEGTNSSDFKGIDFEGFVVALGSSTISVTGSTSFNFNGSNQGPTTSSTTGSTGAVTYSYSGTGATSYSASATRPTNAGTYQVIATLAADSNYAGAVSSPYAFIINKVNSSISATGTTGLTYNGLAQGPNTSTATGSTGAVTYSYSGTGATSYSATATRPTNEGTYQVIATLAADSNYNGAVSSPLAFTINKALLTITANNVNKTYGTALTGASGSSAFTSSGLQNGQTIGSVTITYGTGAAATAAVTTYNNAVTPSAATGGTYIASNYTITYTSGNIIVGAKTLTIGAPSIASKAYDGTTTAGSVSLGALSGFIGSETVTATAVAANYSSANVGSYASTVITYTLANGLNGGLANNYSLANGSATGTITKQVITINANNANKTYGQTLTSGSGSSAYTITSGALQNGETPTVTITYGTGAANTAAVGTNANTVVPSAATGGGFLIGNYTVTYTNGNIVVGQAPLTITANNVNKTYGATLTGASGSSAFTSSGLQNGQTIGSVTLAYGTGAAATAAVATYTSSVTPSSATGGTFTASNYAITYATGNIIVEKANLTLTATLVNKTYGTTLTGGTGYTDFTSSGLQNSETVGSVTVAYGTGSASNAAVGTYSNTVTISAATGGTFTAANYTITYATGDIIVSPGAFAKLQILLPGESAAPGTGSGKTGSPAAQTTVGSFTVTVNAVDAFWNIVATAPSNTIAITSTDGAAILPANNTLASGTRTFTITLKTSGSSTITATNATNGSITANTSDFVIVSAGTKTSTKTGNWSDATVWSPAGEPYLYDLVNIATNHAITVPANGACASINFTGTNSTLSVSTGITLNVTGDVTLVSYSDNRFTSATIGGLGTLNTGTLNIGLGTVLNNNNNSENALTLNIANLNVSGDFTIYNNDNGGGDANEPRVTINSPCILSASKLALIQTGSGNGGSRIITFNANSGATVNLSGGTNPITINSERSLATGKVVFNINSNSTFNYSGSVSQTIPASISNSGSGGTTNAIAINYGNLTIDNTTGTSTSASTGRTINVAGNWTNNGVFTATSSTVNFDGNGAQAITGTSVTTFNDVTIEKTAGTLSVNTDTNIGDDLTFIASGGTLSIDNAIVLTVTDNLTLNNNASGAVTATITGEGTLNVLDSVNVGVNITPSTNSTIVTTLNSSVALFNISTDLNINSYYNNGNRRNNGVFNLISGTLILNGEIDTYNENSSNTSTFSMATGTQSGILKLLKAVPFNLSSQGNNTVNLNGTNALVEYMGSVAQTALGTTYRTLKINNSNLATGVTLGSNATATTLDLTNGLLTTGANTITVASGGSVINDSAASYVNGKLARVLTNTLDFTYPVGKDGVYSPVVFTYASNPGTKTVTIEQFETSSPFTSSPASLATFGSRYWNITQSSTSTAYRVGLNDGGNSGSLPLGASVVMLRKDNTTVTANATNYSAPNYTNVTAFAASNVSNDVSLGVNNIPLSITGVTGINTKIYDGTNTATGIGTPTLTGTISSGDSVTLSGTAVYTFSDKHVGTGKTVTVSGLTLTGPGSGGYSLPTNQIPGLSGEITIRPIVVTAVTNSKTYNGTTSSSGVPTYALQSGDITATIPSQSFDTKDIGTNKVLTPSGLVINDGNGGNNYSISYAPVSLGTINAKSLTASIAATVISKSYDGNTSATLTTANYVLSGIVSSENVIITNTTGTYDNKNFGTGKTVTVTGLVLGGSDVDNYVLSNPTSINRNVGTISKTTLIATVIGTVSKQYDGNNSATLTSANYTLGGLVPLEDVTITNTSGTYDNKRAGINKTVTVTGLVMTGSDINNYNLFATATGAVGEITQKPLSIIGATSSDKIYDTTTAVTVTGGSLVGVLGADDVLLIQEGTFPTINAGGPYVITAACRIAGDDASNYSLIQPSISNASITRKELILIAVATSDKVYDANNTAILTGGGLAGVYPIDGPNVSFIPSGYFADVNVGNWSITSTTTLSGSASGNYYLTQPIFSVKKNITPKGLTVNGFIANDKVYDGTTSSSINSSGASLSGVLVGQNVTLNSGSVNANFDTKNVGTDKTVTIGGFTISGPDASNYAIIQPNTTANITLRPLIITATNQTKCSGSASAFVGNEFSKDFNVSGDITSVTLNVIGGDGSMSGTYSIRPSNASGAGISNYGPITYIDGELIVKSTPTATITGTAAACLNDIPAIITFTGSNGSGVVQYKFYYTINGGSELSVTSNPGVNTAKVSVPTAISRTDVYALTRVEDMNNGCSKIESGTATLTIGACTQVRPLLCGQTLPALTTAFQVSPVSGATLYRFEVTRIDTNTLTYITTPDYYFLPASQIPGGLVYGKSYSVRVQLFIGTWLAYGSTCTITAPNEPVVTPSTTTQVRGPQCGKTLASIANLVEASPVYQATQYEFEVTSDAGTIIVPSNNYYFSLYYSIPGRALYSTSYSIRVRFKLATTAFSAWGATCIVTTPAAPIARMADTNKVEIFNVKAFPNPFASHFSLDIESSSDAQVEMTVYDMIGRQLEVRKSTVSEISVLEVGRNYPSGVYNVVVSQGEKVKTLRMIKR